jgi:hypothetical protein
LAGDDPALDAMNTENYSEMKKEVQKTTLHTIAKVHDFLEMLHRSQNLHATQNESHTHNMLMTTIGYNLDTEEIVQASLPLF